MIPSFSTFLILAGAVALPRPGQSQPASSASSTQVATATAPARSNIQFASKVFAFGRITHGEVIHHDFVFTNVGTATLEITAVRPACGCTTAHEWDRRVEPGQIGIIPIELNSKGFSGEINKKTTIVCNDPAQTNVVLGMTGTIWKPFEISPSAVRFTVLKEALTNQTKVVKIVSQLEQALALSELTSTNAAFQAELKTVTPGKEFELHVTTVSPFGSAASGTILTLKTSVPDAPLVSVIVQATVLEPVVIAPPQITLPEGPLPSARNAMVLIRYNGTNVLTLADGQINAPDATVQMQEVTAGRMFRVTVGLPAGFELKLSDQVELTLRSNHPDYSLIRVPVVRSKVPPGRAAKPVTTAVSTAPAEPTVP